MPLTSPNMPLCYAWIRNSTPSSLPGFRMPCHPSLVWQYCITPLHILALRWRPLRYASDAHFASRCVSSIVRRSCLFCPCPSVFPLALFALGMSWRIVCIVNLSVNLRLFIYVLTVYLFLVFFFFLYWTVHEQGSCLGVWVWVCVFLYLSLYQLSICIIFIFIFSLFHFIYTVHEKCNCIYLWTY